MAAVAFVARGEDLEAPVLQPLGWIQIPIRRLGPRVQDVLLSPRPSTRCAQERALHQDDQCTGIRMGLRDKNETLPIDLSTYLAIYLSIYLSLCLSLCL